MKTIYSIFAAALLPFFFAAEAAFAEWKVRSESNPLDDDGVQSFLASGDFISAMLGHRAEFPYTDLQAKLHYSCKTTSAEVLENLLNVPSHYTTTAMLFNEKPNVREDFSGGGVGIPYFRLKGNGGKTHSVIMQDSHVYGFTFAAIKSKGVFSLPDIFNNEYILPYDNIIVGVPWADDGEVLFKFNITPKMKAAITEIDAICERLKSERAAEKSKSNKKAQPHTGGNK